MSSIAAAVRQPVTVTVGVVLVLLAGAISLGRLPIQLTPNVEDTVVAVTTRWEGASPQEVEQELVDEQEDKLQGVSNLRQMTSTSQQGQGRVRLEFNVGTPKDVALREVSDKLREVPSYPENVDEPVVEASDPESQDFIAWVLLESGDESFDVRTLQDFAEDRIKPALERVPGMSEVNVLGGVEREVQVRFDPQLLASRGVTIAQLEDALRGTNRNVSAGELPEGKSDVRLRFVAQYERVEEVLDTVVADTAGGPLRVRDVAEVVETYKEPRSFVRSRGRPVIAINFQKEVGANVIAVMRELEEAIERMNASGGLLESQARKLGLNGALQLRKVYDQTIYIEDALALVQNNIWLGGGIAIAVLLLFLRSLRSAGIISLAIPISVVGAIVFMVAAGRSINVISLAGLAFAIGMVVDNAIVVLENVYRHLEMGRPAMRAAIDGTREVFGAVLAATLTTVVVFVPILLIEEEAGQLFRDIALAIVAAVALSLVVSVTVVPTAAARLFARFRPKANVERERAAGGRFASLGAWFARPSEAIAGLVHALNGSVFARLAVVLVFSVASAWGTVQLMPPADYLPTGNRNLVFGLLVPPPGYNLEQTNQLALRIENEIRPYFEAGALEHGSAEYERAAAALPSVPTFDFRAMRPGPDVVPPPIDNYFIVSFDGNLFHGGIASEPERVADLGPLFNHATRRENAPGVLAFAFQVPLFRLGGRTGSAIELDFAGDDLDEVTRAAQAAYMSLIGLFGPFNIQPDPSNFNIPGPELRVVPDLRRLSESGVRPDELARAVRALGDGSIVGDYRVGGQTIDLKVVAGRAEGQATLADLADEPLATPSGAVVPLASLAELRRVNAPPQINRQMRQRAVTLQVSPPAGRPLEAVIEQMQGVVDELRASGAVAPTVESTLSGSASKLAAVRSALLGDGTLLGTLSSSLALALLVTYLLMCVLFQSFLRPLIILFSVPLATFGGFLALRLVHDWSVRDRLMPVQNLDVLTMLGFVILIGVVVNNAILIVHQSINFMRGEDGVRLAPRDAITEAVRTRVRPIFMSTLTSVGGMAPLVLMPGSGSELYRGLGSVVVGGLLVSTIFTLLVVPLLFSLVCDLQQKLGLLAETRSEGGDHGAFVGKPLTGAVGLLLLFVVSCAAPVPAADEREALAGRRAEHLAAAATTAVAAPPRAADPLNDLLRARAATLESTSGPGSVEAIVQRVAAAGPAAARVPLGREEALAAAAANNLDLHLAEVEPRIARETRSEIEADFDFVFFAEGSFARADQPSRVPLINGITLGADRTANETATLSAGATRLLRSGASLELASFLSRFENRTPGIDFLPDPAWSSGLTATLRQPLLRGHGRDVAELALDLAELDVERAELRRREELLLVLAATDEAYWDLYEAWARVAVAADVYDRGAAAERVLAARRAFDAETAQYADVLATLERRDAERVRADLALRAASDRLAALMLDPARPTAGEHLFEAAVEPGPDGAAAPELGEALATAFAQRPELARTALDLDAARRRELAAADALDPRLDLSLSLTASGLDDDGAAAIGAWTEDGFVGGFATLRLELPAGNRAARAAERRARLESRSSRLAAERAVEETVLEVKLRWRELETAGRLVQLARRQRLAAAENLRALEAEGSERAELTPEYWSLLLTRQDALAAAQLGEAAAAAERERAATRLDRAVGRAPGGRPVTIERRE